MPPNRAGFCNERINAHTPSPIPRIERASMVLKAKASVLITSIAMIVIAFVPKTSAAIANALLLPEGACAYGEP
jgi:hypothetical protein